MTERELLERRVRHLAEMRGLTLVALAQKAGVGRETIYRMFKMRSPNYSTLSKVAYALDITPGTLLEGAITNSMKDNMRHLVEVCAALNDEALARVIGYAAYERDRI